MENETQSDVQKTEGADPSTITTEPSQQESAVEAEIRKETGSKFTPEEKAAFNLRKKAEEVQALGLDPQVVLGIKQEADTTDKNAPLTIAALEEYERSRGKKTALQLADAIQDDNERELTKIYLEKRIVPSGDAAEDLRMARALVNSVKNGQIAQVQSVKGEAQKSGSAAGAPPKPQEKTIELSREDKLIAQHFGLTQEQIAKSLQ